MQLIVAGISLAILEYEDIIGSADHSRSVSAGGTAPLFSKKLS